MSNSLVIKLKPEFGGYSKKIKSPDNFESLIDIISEIYKKENPNQIYRIKDKKTQNIIKDNNDYECLMLENFTEKDEVILLINIIDKPKEVEYKEESNHLCFKSNLILPVQRELTEEEKIKESIREMVKSKLKILEKSIIDDISKQPALEIQNVHKGIKCSSCGMKNIVGIRYKCTICKNYNLCEICEENIDHDEDHVLLKIKEPIQSEEILEEKINNSIIIPDNDFKAVPEVFNFKKSNLINIQTVCLINNTNILWKQNTKFICVKEKSNLIGNDVILYDEVKPGNYINIEIVYENMEDINPYQTEFYSSFILLDENEKQIGKIHKFKINLK